MGHVRDHDAKVLCWAYRAAGVVLMVWLVGIGGCRNEEIQPDTSQLPAEQAPEEEDLLSLPETSPVESPDVSAPTTPAQPELGSLDLAGLESLGQTNDPALKPPVETNAPAPETATRPENATPATEQPPIDPLAIAGQPVEPIAPVVEPTNPGTVQTTDDFNQRPNTTPASTTYTIQAGDDYVTIADRLWSDQGKWIAIQKANPGVDPKRLRVGQVINIPTPEADSLRRSGELSAASESVALGRSTQVTVEPGDSLSSIAQKVYGSSGLWGPIFEANRGKLKTPDDLKVGMVLAVPPKPRVKSSTPSRRSASPADGFYTVRPGDSLSSIAKKQMGGEKFWRLIYEANRDRLSNPQDIKVGQKLTIPVRDRFKDGDQTK